MFQSTKLVGTALIIAGLGACAPMGAEWTGLEAPKTVKTEVVAESYVVKLTPNAKGLPTGERQELAGFLSRLGDLEEVEFSVRRTHKGLSVGALVPVERELIKMGADGRKVHRLAEIGFDYVGHWADVEIIAKRYVAIAPNCPDFSRSEIIDYTNHNSSNFGCANAAALALSVADPKDLARGRTTDGASGVHQDGAVRRYETDTVKELLISSTQDQSE